MAALSTARSFSEEEVDTRLLQRANRQFSAPSPALVSAPFACNSLERNTRESAALTEDTDSQRRSGGERRQHPRAHGQPASRVRGQNAPGGSTPATRERVSSRAFRRRPGRQRRPLAVRSATRPRVTPAQSARRYGAALRYSAPPCETAASVTSVRYTAMKRALVSAIHDESFRRSRTWNNPLPPGCARHVRRELPRHRGRRWRARPSRHL